MGFPIVAKLLPPLAALLQARFAATQRTLPPAALELVGRYACGGQAVHVSHNASDGRLLIDRLGTYPWTLLPLEGEPDAYRLLMRELPRSAPGCHADAWPGANLCHTSCFREMARGDIELLYATRDAQGNVTALDLPGEGVHCKRAP